MDVAALQAFLAVAETGSFSLAAERVFLTQPAISKRIASLETAIGTRLFDRVGRQVQLTAAGEVLLEQARVILGEIDEARRRIANLSSAVSGSLRLGTSHHVGLHRLPPALKTFRDRYPEVELDLRFMDSEAACRAVEQGALELAVVTLPTQPPPSLICTVLWNDPLHVVVSRTHPLAGSKELSIAQLVKHPAVLPGAGTYTRELILAALGPARGRLEVTMTANFLEVLKMLVAIGQGWSALPETLIDAEIRRLSVAGMTINRQLGIVHHRGRSLSNAARAMMAILGV